MGGQVGASPVVVVAVIVLAAVALYTFLCDLRAERVAKRIVTHVQEHRPEALDTVQWF